MSSREDMIEYDRVEIYEWIRLFKIEHAGGSPTLKEIQAQFEMGSRSTARRAIIDMMARGWILEFTVRGIVLAEGVYEAPALWDIDWEEAEEDEEGTVV